VDAEVAVPELVLQGDLCPHQDYVYFEHGCLFECRGRAGTTRGTALPGRGLSRYHRLVLTGWRFCSPIVSTRIADRFKDIDPLLAQSYRAGSACLHAYVRWEENPPSCPNALLCCSFPSSRGARELLEVTCN
jgi:hypothetical protein